MKTKEQLLRLFEENRGAFFSGEELAQRLAISRTAVWKAVNGLRNQGYPIDAVPKKGYRLCTETDILSQPAVEKYLDPENRGLHLHVFPSVPSTNSVLRDLAADGAPEGTVVLAGEQTAGRGRRGRSFYSPPDTGVYLSVLLRPGETGQAAALTTMAAVAVCEAIEAVSGQTASIKWVNDVYVGGKKVCGILTEASVGLETGAMDYAVVGVGINVCPPAGGFPPELADIAGSVFPAPVNDGKNRLAAEFLNRLFACCREPGDYVNRYRSRCFVLGRDITVLSADGPKRARALDVDDRCRLLVRDENGEETALFAGEISIKPEK